MHLILTDFWILVDFGAVYIVYLLNYLNIQLNNDQLTYFQLFAADVAGAGQGGGGTAKPVTPGGQPTTPGYGMAVFTQRSKS